MGLTVDFYLPRIASEDLCGLRERLADSQQWPPSRLRGWLFDVVGEELDRRSDAEDEVRETDLPQIPGDWSAADVAVALATLDDRRGDKQPELVGRFLDELGRAVGGMAISRLRDYQAGTELAHSLVAIWSGLVAMQGHDLLTWRIDRWAAMSEDVRARLVPTRQFFEKLCDSAADEVVRDMLLLQAEALVRHFGRLGYDLIILRPAA